MTISRLLMTYVITRRTTAPSNIRQSRKPQASGRGSWRCMATEVSEKPRKILAEAVRAASADGHPFALAALYRFV